MEMQEYDKKKKKRGGGAELRVRGRNSSLFVGFVNLIKIQTDKHSNKDRQTGKRCMFY